MKIVCAWCQKGLGEKEPLEDVKVSHGICPSCSEAVMMEAECLRSSMAERQLGKLEAVGSIPTEGSHERGERCQEFSPSDAQHP